MVIYSINLPIRKNLKGLQKVHKYKLRLCNGTIIVLKITLLHSVSVITNFIIPKRDKQTKKHHTFSSTPGARLTIPTIFRVVIEEVRPVFASPNFFDPILSFADRGD